MPKTAKIVRGIGSSSRLPEYKTQPKAESFLKLAGNVRRTERKSGRADASGPALQHLIGRTVAIGPGADVGDDLFAHRQPPLDGGRHHMRQQHDVSHREQPLVNGGLMLEHVEPGARDPPFLKGRDQRRLVDDLAARGVDQIGVALHQPKRSEEHTSELQSLMRTSYAVFCLKKKKL